MNTRTLINITTNSIPVKCNTWFCEIITICYLTLVADTNITFLKLILIIFIVAILCKEIYYIHMMYCF